MKNIEKVAQVIAEQIELMGYEKGAYRASCDIAKEMQKQGFDQKTIKALTGISAEELAEPKH